MTYCSYFFVVGGYLEHFQPFKKDILMVLQRKTDPPKLGRRLTYLWIPNAPCARCFREVVF